MAVPILTTKLHIPSLRSKRVRRQRLLARLDLGLHRRLTLVSAPAGFGKTTLLADWARGLQTTGPAPVKVAWLTLDGGDNDPARLCRLPCRRTSGAGRLGQAGGAAFDLAGVSSSRVLSSPIDQPGRSAASGLVLVLDDYHLITSQAIHDALSFCSIIWPRTCTWSSPPAPIRPCPCRVCRARGHLTELRQSDLRFTAEEAAAFLNNVMGLGLSAQGRGRPGSPHRGLDRRPADGGPLAARDTAPTALTRSEFVQAFTGSHRFVLDYLVEEVLEQQPPALQEFLLKTSILERLTGPLCDCGIGGLGIGDWKQSGPSAEYQYRTPKPAILEHLEAANLFIVPLDDERRWYRYHRLFSDLLRKRLQQDVSRPRAGAARRASAWHERAGTDGCGHRPRPGCTRL